MRHPNDTVVYRNEYYLLAGMLNKATTMGEMKQAMMVMAEALFRYDDVEYPESPPSFSHFLEED